MVEIPNRAKRERNDKRIVEQSEDGVSGEGVAASEWDDPRCENDIEGRVRCGDDHDHGSDHLEECKRGGFHWAVALGRVVSQKSSRL